MASQMMYRSMGLCTCMLVDGTAATVGLARPAGPGATWHYRTVPFKKYSLKLFYCIFVLFVLYCILTPLVPLNLHSYMPLNAYSYVPLNSYTPLNVCALECT